MLKNNQQTLADKFGLGQRNQNLTATQLLHAIKQSELLEDGAIEKMRQTAQTAFALVLNNNSEPKELAAAIYPLERLFDFYYLLASQNEEHKLNAVHIDDLEL